VLFQSVEMLLLDMGKAVPLATERLAAMIWIENLNNISATVPDDFPASRVLITHNVLYLVISSAESHRPPFHSGCQYNIHGDRDNPVLRSRNQRPDQYHSRQCAPVRVADDFTIGQQFGKPVRASSNDCVRQLCGHVQRLSGASHNVGHKTRLSYWEQPVVWAETPRFHIEDESESENEGGRTHPESKVDRLDRPAE
jgi:hypothetical protein